MNPASGWSRNRSLMASPTVDSDGVKPGRSALVESDRRDGRRRYAAISPRGEVGLAPVDRIEVELEVAGVEDRAGRVK